MISKCIWGVLLGLFALSVLAEPLQPSEQWSYQVRLKQDLRWVYGGGLCKIDGDYHFFMTAGITYKTSNRKDWEMYYAIPFEQLKDKKLHGGPNPYCGKEPYFTSPTWGLYYWKNNKWIKKGGPLDSKIGSLNLVTGDRQRMYYSRSDKKTERYIVSSEQGWWKPGVLIKRKDYYYTYYQSDFGFVGQSREKYNVEMPVHIKSNKVTKITGVKPGIIDGGLMLNNQFYLIRREGENGKPWSFIAYAVDRDFYAHEVNFSPLHLTEAGPYECYSAQPDLAICRYNFGLVFVAETPAGLGAVALPLRDGWKAGGKVYYTCVPGVDTLYCDDSKGEYRDGGLPYWVGSVSEFRYDDIVKRIQDDYHAYKKIQEKERTVSGGVKE